MIWAAEILSTLALPVDEAAQSLLGWRLETKNDGELVSVVLSEVEAYGGVDDSASHSYRGPTDRNQAMFGPLGTLYVYRSYGIHWCANVVAGQSGHAILLRGAIPDAGLATIQRRRQRSDHLTDGPGKLAQAMGITDLHDGTSVIDGPVRLIPPERPIEQQIVSTPRIGISREKDRPWRFVLVR